MDVITCLTLWPKFFWSVYLDLSLVSLPVYVYFSPPKIISVKFFITCHKSFLPRPCSPTGIPLVFLGSVSGIYFVFLIVFYRIFIYVYIFEGFYCILFLICGNLNLFSKKQVMVFVLGTFFFFQQPKIIIKTKRYLWRCYFLFSVWLSFISV